MATVNLQVRISEDVEAALAAVASPSKSDFVREAILEKIQRERFAKLEHQWVEALQEHPDEGGAAKDWLKVEAWGSK